MKGRKHAGGTTGSRPLVPPAHAAPRPLRYTGMGLGVSAILAACKQASTSAGAIPSGSPRPAMDSRTRRPPGVRLVGLRQRQLLPRGREAVPVAATTRRPRATRRSSSCSRTTTPGFTKVAAGTTYDIVHPCAYRFQDYVNLGAMQPWDTSQIPNYSALNPVLEKAGQIDGQQYFIVEDWGFIAPLIARTRSIRRRTPGRCCSTTATPARSRGSTRWRCWSSRRI